MMAVVVVAGLFLIAAAPADARGRGGGGGGHGVRGGGHGHGFHGHRFHGHHGFRSSVVIGTGVWLGPYWGPYWYPPYYPAYEPVVIEQQPQSYIQQPSPSYWYYCEDARAYYPYVQQCPGGWLTVVPQAAPETPR
jgi:hypothetical protein